MTTDERDALIAAQAAEIARLRGVGDQLDEALNGNTSLTEACMDAVAALAAPSPTAARGAALLRVARAAQAYREARDARNGIIAALDRLDAALAAYDALKESEASQ